MENLTLLLRRIISSNEPDLQFQAENELIGLLRDIRNGSQVSAPNKIDFEHNGVAYTAESKPLSNEQKFSSIYKLCFDLNEQDVEDDVLTKYDHLYEKILSDMESDKLWYQLPKDELLASQTPRCRIASVNYVKERMNEVLAFSKSKDKRPKSMYQDIEMDTEIVVENDRYIDRKKVVKSSKYLNFRLQNELDPYYATHPCEMLLVNTLIYKVISGKMFYGIRFLKLMMEHFKDDTFPYYHLPVEFRTNGNLVASQWHTFAVLQMRYVINLQANLVFNQHLHEFKDEYLQLSEELMNFILADPYGNGKLVKKHTTPISLYFGMDLRLNPEMRTQHLHPKYNITEQQYTQYPSVFYQHEDCTTDCMTNIDKVTYTASVRKFVADGVKGISDLGLKLYFKFTNDKLLPYRPHKHIIYDLLFVKLHISSGGYAHSHKLRDFIPPILQAYEENEKYIETKDYQTYGKEIATRMLQIGYNQTSRLLDDGAYPDPTQFKVNLSKYLTSKSAGLASIELAFTYMDILKKTKHTVRMTAGSKAARAALTGAEVYDLSKISSPFDNVIDYYNSLNNTEKERIKKNGLSETDLAKLGVSRIGSRATSSFRAIRAIFMVRLEVHIMQSAIIQPHVDDTSRSYHNDQVPTSFWIGERDYGYSILTQDQNGSDDAFARFVMATSSGKYLISCADCTAWDQHFKNIFLSSYYKGIQLAFNEKTVLNDKSYMVKNGENLNLSKCVDEFMHYQIYTKYIAEYGDEARIIDANFLTSGRLDTFMLNSIQNTVINELINKSISKLPGAPSYIALSVAGDDMAALVKVPGDVNSKTVESIKNETVNTYKGAGHEISVDKSVLSGTNYEEAKRHAKHGMYYRDSTVQFYESEKSNKAENMSEYVRGQVQKQFEAYRRCVGDAKTSALMMRLHFGLSYQLKIVDRSLDSDTRGKVRKYYPPYAAVILPTMYSGALGCTFTGVSSSEVLFIMRHMPTPQRSISVCDNIRFLAKEQLPNALIKHVLPREKLDLAPGITTNFKMLDVQAKSKNTDDVAMDVRAGLEFTKLHSTTTRKMASEKAIASLQSDGIKVSSRMKLMNAPYTSFIQFAKTLTKTRTTDKDDIVNNLHNLFDFDAKKILFSDSSRKLIDDYDIYKMIKISCIFWKHDDLYTKTASVRMVSTPHIAQMMEKVYGPRQGKGIRLNLQGVNQELQKFINRTGISLTAQQLSDEISKSGVANNDLTMKNQLTHLLTAISGEPTHAARAVEDLEKADATWGDAPTAATISGTLIDHLDLSPQNISKYVTEITPSLPIPRALRMLFKYSAFLYAQQHNAYYVGHSPFIKNVLIEPDEVLEGLHKLESSSVGSKKASNTYIQQLYDLYERCNSHMRFKVNMYRDENMW